jgi:hypothetical protein
MTPFPGDILWLQSHINQLATSYLRWTGRPLFEGVASANRASVAWNGAAILVSHGTELDPILNFGNQSALRLWDMSWEDFIRTPSRLTAEAPEREERARLMAEVTARGYIDNYAGIRIARTGRRFRIQAATVWNVLDESGQPAGQAATFEQWNWL